MAKKTKDVKKEAGKSDPPYTDNIYDRKDDIYSRAKEEQFEEDASGEDKPVDDDLAPGLDIPGAELDDKLEEIGEEDEENNYYSLGGDNHEDLEEDKD